MSARGNLVIKDRAATPADHTFTPDGRDNNGAHLYSEKSGVAIGDRRFSAQARRAGGRYKASLRLNLPTVQTQTINGVSSPVVVSTNYVDLVFNFDEKSTEQERKDAVGFIQNALAPGNTQINDLLVNYSDIY
jgi:hypothetical protein